ncbi:MAG: PocR ligand-binding domain-containing protein [Ardenticatenaceae bacterium]|nr:PocR ligand-binding domain-containing protein [Ardenticatenaceae bacterium]
MSDLLTTKQVQTLLQVDRTTIYRMRKDGRLSAVKLGHQWRFPSQQIRDLLDGRPLSLEEETPQAEPENLPIYCFQSIQDIFTDITEIGAMMTNLDGEPLTEPSTVCKFCRMMLDSKTGHQACQASWRKMVASPQKEGSFAVCHAGLHYLQAPIDTKDPTNSLLIVGQFYSHAPDKAEEAARIRQLARKHNLDEAALANAAHDVLVLDGRCRAKIGGWLRKMTAVFEHISCERLGFVNRLRQIANMSDLANEPIRPLTQ